MQVTIYDTNLNQVANEFTYSSSRDVISSRPLVHLKNNSFDSKWYRKPWIGTPHQGNPKGAGASNFNDGWVILTEIHQYPELTGDKIHATILNTPDSVDLVNLTATYVIPTATKPVATRKQEMLTSLKSRSEFLIAQGFSYTVPGNTTSYTYQIDDKSQGYMLAVFAGLLDNVANPHGGYWRSKNNVNVPMTDAENKAFLRAAKDYKMSIIRRSQAIVDAILAAADHTTLDGINIDAGSIASVGSWPAN